MSSPYLPTGRGLSAALDPAPEQSVGTPLYDALVEEFRLALRTVPGDRGADEGLTHTLIPLEYGFTPIARRSPVSFPRQVSRHRGAPDDERGSSR